VVERTHASSPNGQVATPKWHDRGRLGPIAVGRVTLKNPVMNAAGTYGAGAELASFGDLSALGAFVTKSLSLRPWRGNQGHNLTPAPGGGMLNSVGLKNPGVRRWIEEDYPRLAHTGAAVVVSLWGTTVEAVVSAAMAVEQYTDAIAIEVNLSCPNSGSPHLLVSHDPGLIRRQIGAIADRLEHTPVWAKLAPSAPDIVACAAAAADVGADAVTLVNTLSAMAVDTASQAPTLSGIYGGLSGPPLHAIALRAVHQVHAARQDIPIIGVGGVSDKTTALRMFVVGARAVQVGTACFADPRTPHKLVTQLSKAFGRGGFDYGALVGSGVTAVSPHEFGTRVAAPASPDPPGRRRSRIDIPERAPRRLPPVYAGVARPRPRARGLMRPGEES